MGMILLTVCKYVNIAFNSRAIAEVRGLSGDTLSALAANIDSCEWRCRYIYSVDNNLPMENPGASFNR